MNETKLIILVICAIPLAASLYAWLCGQSYDNTRPPRGRKRYD